MWCVLMFELDRVLTGCTCFEREVFLILQILSLEMYLV
jgi:hypothetical protein